MYQVLISRYQTVGRNYWLFRSLLFRWQHPNLRKTSSLKYINSSNHLESDQSTVCSTPSQNDQRRPGHTHIPNPVLFCIDVTHSWTRPLAQCVLKKYLLFHKQSLLPSWMLLGEMAWDPASDCRSSDRTDVREIVLSQNCELLPQLATSNPVTWSLSTLAAPTEGSG